MKAAVIAILICFLLVEQRQEDVDKDRRKLQGTWIVVSAKTGDRTRDERFSGTRVVCTDDRMEFFRSSGGSEGSWQFTLNPSKNPKHIEFHAIKNNKQITLSGIYEVGEERIRLCWSIRPHGMRPEEFGTNPGKDEVRLFVLERQK